MNAFRSVCTTLLTLVAGLALAQEAENAPIQGLGPVGPVKKVAGGFTFLEGPAADSAGNLVFSDVRGNKLHKLDAAGKVSVFRDPSNNCNGTMFNSAGELVACEMGTGRVVAMNAWGAVVRVLTDSYDGKRYNAPNDLVIDNAGGVYFTDPNFGAPKPDPQDVTAVYYIATNGKVSRLISDLKLPNGVILSPDEKTLFVIPSGQADMMAYTVQSPGKLGPGRVFCTLQQPPGVQGKGGDGLTVDVKGNLYITSAVGLQVFSPDGKALGIIKFPEQPANCTFGGPDRKTLYATCRTSLYAAPMEIAGHAFAQAR